MDESWTLFTGPRTCFRPDLEWVATANQDRTFRVRPGGLMEYWRATAGGYPFGPSCSVTKKGAVARCQGRFESAEGGTIFLDETGEPSGEIQMTLLRVLQKREFDRVGGVRPIRANVRVIAATNRDLEAAIAENTFRSDLFYRQESIALGIRTPESKNLLHAGQRRRSRVQYSILDSGEAVFA